MLLSTKFKCSELCLHTSYTSYSCHTSCTSYTSYTAWWTAQWTPALAGQEPWLLTNMASLLFIILLSRILSCLTKHCQSKKAQTRALSSQATHFQWVGQPDFRPAQLPHSGSPIIIFWPLTPPPISLSFSTAVVRKQYTAAYMHWWSLKHTWKCGKY